jgi:glycosyltransferase involved in cell wall biosynthesis
MGNQLPLVCICIPTYNSASTIEKTLSSLLNQTYPNISFIVVDNCSTDQTIELVESFRDPRVRVIKNSHNLGAEGNFNRCIELAHGKYSAIYHADDIYEETMVAQQVGFLESNPKASGVFTEATIIDEFGRFTGSIAIPVELRQKGPLYYFFDIFKAILKNSNFLICPSLMTRTDIFQKEIKSWRGELFSSSADLDVWFRLLELGPIGLLPKKLMRYRISNQQFSSQVRTITARADFFKVIDFYLKNNSYVNSLSSDDIRNYSRLERRDLVMRSMNALLEGDNILSRDLCPSLWRYDIFESAVTQKRGLVVFLAIISIKTVHFFGMEGLVSPLLSYIKKVSGK